MEVSEDQQIRLEICERCYQHQSYDSHSEKEYQENYEQFTQLIGQAGLKVLRNAVPKYFKKASDTKASTKRYVDTNTGKIVEFPTKGCFEVYYKSILVFSKLQNSAFPDLSFLCLILKLIRSFCQTNPSFLDALQKFRDIEYEWKKSPGYNESLYNYIRLNAYGNTSEKCISDIFMSLINNAGEGKSAKKKIIYPYLIYDLKEKKNKMENIYCPRTAGSQYFSQRSTTSALPTRRFAKKQINLARPMTGNREQQMSKTAANSLQAPKIGAIVKNVGKNNIFQLVLKEQNRNFNSQKLKQMIKDENLQLKTESLSGKVRKVNLKGKAESKQKLQLWSISKDKKQNESKHKQVYVAHLQTLQQNNKKMKEKLHINLKKNARAVVNDEMQTERKPNQNNQGNLSSSRFGSIKKNVISRLQEDESRQKCMFEMLEDAGDQNVYVPSIQHRQEGNNAQNAQNQITAASKCLKQSQYSRKPNLDQPLNQNEQQESKKTLNEAKSEKRISGQQKKQKLSVNSDVSMDESVRDSVLKRASIQEATVQKRISERKRSSNHERYPHQLLQKSKLAIQRTPSQQSEKAVTTIDPVTDNFSPQDISQSWQKLRENDHHTREPALIIKKFVDQQNFINCNSYSRYDEIIKCPDSPEVEFTITGEELTNKFTIASIRTVCKAQEIRLFPQIFKQIEQNVQGPFEHSKNQSRFKMSAFGYRSSKLMHVVNLMLRSNPMMISRIFEDKKNVNPYGVYCIWLRSCSGCFQPIFINDSFAFEEKESQAKLKPVYSWLSNQNSIWYMLLEKALAKVVGGYHLINSLSLAQLMSVIMGSPTVDIGYINPQKAIKVFDQKIFYNKMASVYTLRQGSLGFSSLKEGGRVDRIIGFSYNKRDPKQSAVSIKIEESTLTVSIRQFLLTYGEVSLLFFNNNYFLNQTSLIIENSQHSVLSCRLASSHSKNNCYLMFSCFPEKMPTKVTLYRQLTDDQAEIKEGMNPLSEQDRRYEYIGEIYKTGNFFFEVQLNGGEYICLMENSYEVPPYLSIFAEYPVRVADICSNQFSSFTKQKSKKTKKNDKKQITVSSKSSKNGFFETPKVLIQHKIPLSKFKEDKIKKLKNDENIPPVSIKVKREYAFQPDNFYEMDEEKEEITEKTKRAKPKQPKMNSACLKQIKQQNQQSICQMKITENRNFEPVEVPRSRIIDNYS